jgi:methionyl-tRNA synthetase
MGFSLKPSDRKYKDTNPEDLDFSTSKGEIIQKETVEEFNPWDYVRVVNVKGEPEFQETSDEKIIVGHRGNPILGNKHQMLTQTMKERDRVIAEHKKDLDADLAIQGPIFQALKEIAKDIVENKIKMKERHFRAIMT